VTLEVSNQLYEIKYLKQNVKCLYKVALWRVSLTIVPTGNATMLSVCIVEPHANVYNIKMLL
jgi:hypothetical protein